MEVGQQVHVYILEEQIGRGGMGVVWRARHQYFDKVVAIKAIYPHFARDPQLYARFLREAQILDALKHPRIVHVHDFFSLDGNTYLVMDYIEGKSLQTMLKSCRCIPLPKAVEIARDILDALETAHSKGIIHRDVKPSNIIVTPEGQAYLVDFGIALMRGAERFTQVGGLVGTEKYMSPEQIREKELDPRTDIYSFGCVLYEMLAGRPPFGGDVEGNTEHAILEAHLHETPTPLRQRNPAVDEQTEAVVMRALAKSPEDRFKRCQDMAEALHLASPLRDLPPPHPPVSWLRKWRRVIVRGGVGVGMILVVLVLIGLGRGGYLPDLRVLFGRDEPTMPLTPDKIVDNFGIEFLLIRGGEFRMGTDDPNSDKDEQPVHHVRIGRSFYLGRYEVTQGQWEAVMGENPSRFQGKDLPVENVSWEKAQEFIRRLQAKMPEARYRLPTEAEWEYAARAGSKTAYYFGDDAAQIGDYAWCRQHSQQRTHAVGQLQPNAWGLYDMLGNVREWVQDWYGDYRAGSEADPRGPASGTHRVSRGGSWGYSDFNCRVTNRDRNPPDYGHAQLGFRLLRATP